MRLGKIVVMLKSIVKMKIEDMEDSRLGQIICLPKLMHYCFHL
jgi:hypothetical protein